MRVKRQRGPSTPPPGFPDTLRQLEEALRLLRQTPVAALLVYWGATAAFAGAFIYFWADMSRSAFAWRRCPALAVGLAVLYPFMKTMQAYFCAWLTARRQNTPPPSFQVGIFLRVFCSQAWWQSLGFVLLPVAAVATLPMAWTIAFFQNLTVFAWSSAEKAASPMTAAARQSFFRPRQNHAALFILSLFALIVFIDFIVLIVLLPGLAKSLLGIETVFTIGINHMFNTTLLASAAALTYVVMDMFLKAFYVIRCFHGAARKTGDDLLVDLRRFRLSHAAKVMIAGWLCVGGTASAGAAEPVIDENELDQTIEKVVQSPRYAWRAPRENPLPEDHYSYSWFQAVGQWAKSCFDTLVDLIEKIEAFFNRLFRGKDYPARGPFRWFGGVTIGEVILWIAALILAAWIGRILWRRFSGRKPQMDMAAARPRIPVVDLTSEDVSAEDLDEDEWFLLAAEKVSEGEFRLALRALFLGSVAGLGRRRLVQIRRYKSNRDYLRELKRREGYCGEELRDFSEVADIFEQVWYGTRTADEHLYQDVNRPARRLAMDRAVPS
ncbi:MAG: DUF4129 domain-containing protein [Lentisphaeria bacterium]|nr:DUF4129 domain-containing protein [Lentisphaeria bacterium]